MSLHGPAAAQKWMKVHCQGHSFPTRLRAVILAPDCAVASVLFDSLVDRAGVLFGQAVAYKVVVDPHEPADYSALLVPAPHHRLHLAWRVVLVPHAGENRHLAKIPTRA